MKVVVLCGPESSGKSWLSGEIQAHFGGVVVSEYVRHFIDREQRDTCYADIPTIAQGQLAWEDQARQLTPELLILDTHLLSNMLWSHALFDDCPPWLEQALLARHYDLHLLLSPKASAGWTMASAASPTSMTANGSSTTVWRGWHGIANRCRSSAENGRKEARQP